MQLLQAQIILGQGAVSTALSESEKAAVFNLSEWRQRSESLLRQALGDDPLPRCPLR